MTTTAPDALRAPSRKDISMTLDTDWALAWVRTAAAVVAERRAHLVDLDREIGDGDHGENLQRGFAAVLPALDALPEGALPADVLKKVATTLISTVGGASGPLLGTAFLKGSQAIAGRDVLDADAVVAFLEAARDGVVLRGKAESGDATMVDAWTPAVDAARSAAAAGSAPEAVLRSAADAAVAGAEATEPLVARKGRASYLGERAIGHRDPGAESSSYLLVAAADAAEEVRS